MGVLTVVTEVFVPGHAKTKGSMRAVGQGRMVQSVAGSTSWAALMTDSVRRERANRGLVGPGMASTRPVGVRIAVWLQPPYALDPARRNMPYESATWPGAGDVDKIARNVLDALKKAHAYADDNQVVRLIADEFPASPTRPAGLLIQAWEIDSTESMIRNRIAGHQRIDHWYGV